MGRYTARRLLEAIPTLIFVSIVVFGLIRMAPGDPAAFPRLRAGNVDPDRAAPGSRAAPEEPRPQLLLYALPAC